MTWESSTETPGRYASLHPIHSHHTIHIRLMRQANILVDKDDTIWIGGLANALILPHPTARTVEGRTSTDQLSRSCAPELTWPGAPPNLDDPTYPTKASDMYGFGIMAWEVRAGSFGWYHSACSPLTGSHRATAVL